MVFDIGEKLLTVVDSLFLNFVSKVKFIGIVEFLFIYVMGFSVEGIINTKKFHYLISAFSVEMVIAKMNTYNDWVLDDLFN